MGEELGTISGTSGRGNSRLARRRARRACRQCALGSLADLAPVYVRSDPDRQCIVDGYFRLDNMLFDIKGGAEPVAVLDWQTVTVGKAMTDAGYFVCCGIGEVLWRKHEDDLLELWLVEMAGRGVTMGREPLHKLRLVMDECEGISVDLTFTSRAFPIEEPRFTHRIGPRAFMDYTHMTQNGQYEGWISTDGDRRAGSGNARAAVALPDAGTGINRSRLGARSPSRPPESGARGYRVRQARSASAAKSPCANADARQRQRRGQGHRCVRAAHHRAVFTARPRRIS